MHPPFEPLVLERLIGCLSEIRQHAEATARELGREVELAAPGHRSSARNLLHYLALRQHDLRELQPVLTSLGLSSLGRTEAHVLAAVDVTLAALHRLAGRPFVAAGTEPDVDHVGGPAALARHAEALLGAPPPGRDVRVMVTLPAEAATGPELARALIGAGMDIGRINCAHDAPAVWEAIARNVRRASEEIGRPCRLLVDLAGPKLRTGRLEPGPEVLRVKPTRDARGRVVAPAILRLVDAEADAAPDGFDAGDRPLPPAGAAEPPLPVVRALLEAARPGDALRIVDARGKKRCLTILGPAPCGGLRAALHRGAWFESGARATLRRDGRTVAKGALGRLPSVEAPVVLRDGDRLCLTAGASPGRPAVTDAAGRVLEPARIPCTLPEVFTDVRPGERIWFDDGRIGGTVERADAQGLEIRITSAGPAGARLRADRGINLPDSALSLPALTPKDLADLGFAAGHADMVGLSFVRSPEDVATLVRELEARGVPDLGIVLKIETRLAFERLPRLLLAALRSPPVGVMVARGDLAVECGFDRLAEVQEEILWLCEAAHVPVVWATQVLEGLAKTGLPSRAEVTDAAMSGRAECVMLNKGPHVVEAVRFLDSVLRRMQDHQRKKRSMLRKLAVSRVGAEAERIRGA